MENCRNLIDLIGKQVLIFDGGTGSVLQGMGLQPGELPERWNYEHPDKIQKLHYDYFAAGSNIVNSNTFGANSLKFDDEELEKIVRCALENAKAAREKIEAEKSNPNSQKTHFIAIDIGPCGKLLKPLGDISFEEAVKVFARTIELGLKYGADCILIETMNDLYEAKAAILAAKEVRCKMGREDAPILATAVFDESALTLTGSSPELMVTYLSSLKVDALGVNCSLGPEQMVPIVKRILAVTKTPVMIKPNAGLPRSENGKTVYDVSPDKFAQIVSGFVKDGAAIVGGCCGTTAEHIRLLVEKCGMKDGLVPVAKGFVPKKTGQKTFETAICSNSKIVRIGGFNKPVLIGERINPTGKKKFKQALRDNDIQYIIGEGITQQEKGCHVLDVNVGLPEIDETAMMEKVIYELQSVTDLPLQIDTSNPETMEKALRLYNGKALVNSVNGKQEIMDQVFPLVKKYGGTLIALTLDEGGIPESAEGRLAIAKKIAKEAEKYGIPLSDIVFDPLAMAISSDDKAGIETLKAIKFIHDQMQANTSLGVSNVSFGLPVRDMINSTFFTMAMQNGLKCAIMNPNSLEMMKAYHTYCTIAGYDSQCLSYIKFADQYSALQSQLASNTSLPASSSPEDKACDFPSDSLEYAIVKGLKEKSAQITGQLLNEGMDSLDLINNKLIPALDFVGKGFEKKKVYLPQLLMAAESAKAGFDVIKEVLGKSGAKSESKGSVILATVKGDIHDIGKNIVKVILENYSFDVIDLGKDVPPEEIVKVCLEKHIKLVGLSALMTTTVPSMEETIKQLREKAPWCKVVVGGAVLTQEYANMIGADAYAKDAMETVSYAQKLFS
ncbi:MAG: homocysteine S-methyltransferase family protein [Treponemataceae bacterium]|nr:homocysteine S-methyltransferase family protein [Treponemataceae bacterium]